MKSKPFKLRFPMLLAVSVVVCPLIGTGAKTEFSITHIWNGDAGMDNGGELGSNQTHARIGYNWSLGRGSSLGLSIGAGIWDYDFSGTGANALGSPWGKVTEYSIGLGWRRTVGSDGVLYLAPGINVSRGAGADWSDSIQFGTIINYGYRVSDALTIGVGAGVYTGLEETRAFPVLLVDWQIDENWRVGNPFRPGPTGPAGLEISYAVNPEWEIALGGGWRSQRFRLDEDGSVPDGVGEVEGIPVFVRLTWSASENISLDAYLGQFLSGEVTVENRKGKRVSTDDLDSAPIAGLSLTGRF